MTDQQYDNVVLGGFVNVGDILVVTHPDDEHGPNPRDLPVGTRIRCTGFTHYHDYIDYGWCGPECPRGKYLRYGTPVFELVEQPQSQSGQYFSYSLYHLKFEDESLDKQRDRRDTHEWKMSNDGVRVGDLPESDFTVGDRVCFVDEGRMESSGGYTFTHGEIYSINYNRMFEERELRYDVTLHYIDSEGKPASGGTYPYMRAKDLVLMKRGNFYIFENGGTPEFENLKEEADFYNKLGRSVQLRNHRTGDYSWSLEQALVSIAGGDGCVLRMGGGMFGGIPSPTVYDYPTMPGLSERLRAETVKGFANEYAKINAGQSLT